MAGKKAAKSEVFLSDRERFRQSLKPRQHYVDCEAREKELEKHPPSLDRVLGQLLFNGRTFLDQPVGKLKVRSDPFHIVIATATRLRISTREWRYRKILELLRNQPDREFRWLLIANWLKQEGVCQPEEFLPAEVRRNLIKRYHQYLPMSSADLYHRALIRNWLTYFERIRTELRAKGHLRRVREEVAKLDYDMKAVARVAKRRSTTINAICQWLAERGKGDARKLRNSYSRLHGHAEERALRLEHELLGTTTPSISSKK
jgi:hypothetical protein